MAVAVVTTIQCVVLFFFAQRFFMRGIAMTGIRALVALVERCARRDFCPLPDDRAGHVLHVRGDVALPAGPGRWRMAWDDRPGAARPLIDVPIQTADQRGDVGDVYNARS